MRALWITLLTALAMPLFAADVGPVESFGAGLNGWVAYDLINEQNASSLTLEGGAAKVRYGAQSMPMPPEEHVVRADNTASGAQFVGDYISKGIAAFSFRIKPESDATLSVLIQNSSARRRWEYDVTGLPQGTWSTVVVPVDPSELVALHSGGTSGQLIEDLQNVSWIGVLVRRSSRMAEQVTWLDDFQLIGPGQSFASWMTQATGTTTWQAEMLPDADFDGDGMVNQDEFIAGTDSTDSGDVFTVDGSARSGSDLTLRWESVAGRTYNVLKAASPGGAYTVVHSGIQGTPPENSYTDTGAAANGPWFYKIEVTKTE